MRIRFYRFWKQRLTVFCDISRRAKGSVDDVRKEQKEKIQTQITNDTKVIKKLFDLVVRSLLWRESAVWILHTKWQLSFGKRNTNFPNDNCGSATCHKCVEFWRYKWEKKRESALFLLVESNKYRRTQPSISLCFRSPATTLLLLLIVASELHNAKFQNKRFTKANKRQTFKSAKLVVLNLRIRAKNDEREERMWQRVEIHNAFMKSSKVHVFDWVLFWDKWCIGSVFLRLCAERGEGECGGVMWWRETNHRRVREYERVSESEPHKEQRNDRERVC
jgi:hypothetical protein